MTGFDPTLPLERAATIPAEWYTRPEVAQAERERVFARTWLVAGRTDQVVQPGQFFTVDLAGEPILVIRGTDGVLRGFFNVCRHRAARVATEECGTATKLRCRYHGWTYDLAGELRGLPEFEGVADFERDANGLRPVTVAEWGPFVFVHLTTPAQPLAEFLAPMPQLLEPLGLGQLAFVARKSYDLDCNWKVYCDNFMDGGYHVNTLHESLAAVLDYKNYRTELHGWCNVQSSPMKPPPPGSDGSAGSVRSGTTAAYWWLYPNFMLNAYSGVMDTNLVLPLAPDRCRVVFDFYFPRAAGAEATAEFQRQTLAVADPIQAEDMDICADVQRGLGSRSFSTGRFSVRRESGVHHFHRLLAEQLAGPLH